MTRDTAKPRSRAGSLGAAERLAGALAAALLAGAAMAAEPAPAPRDEGLDLPPGLMTLLRQEMRALADGVETLATAIPRADWPTVAETARRMEASYILKQRLTPARKKVLAGALPAHFKRLDARFHAQAGRLAAAASRGDAELAAFHLYRLVDTCTACHAAYARGRFPGFGNTGGPATAEARGGHEDLIVLESPRPDETVRSPLKVTGRARGSWYFEGDFPVVLTDWDGRIIAETHATARGPWMTSGFVPFSATVRFERPGYGDRGFLILRKDNASGLPEHDDALEVRVRFGEGPKQR